ncbi:hypothetical protein V5O48_011003 [Marasmius crinis-equi]|uniref:F-box domain-containing protein n=1 Tax=Marasmius crinis-equi TaxID=585013 RepID=A0ABR3F6T9_9AGAR
MDGVTRHRLITSPPTQYPSNAHRRGWNILLGDCLEEFLPLLPFVDLIRINRVCRSFYQDIEEHRRRVYDVDRFMSTYIDPACIANFRHLQAQTNALIAGLCVTLFMSGRRSLDYELGLFCHHAQAAPFPFFFTQTAGYTYTPFEGQPETVEELQPWISQQATSNRGYTDERDRGVVTRLQFIKTRDLQDKEDEYQRSIVLTVTKKAPVEAVLPSPNTCSLAIMTPTHAISLFPYTSFELAEAVICRRFRPLTPDFIETMSPFAERGFHLRCALSRNAALKFKPDVAVNRAIGDPQTLMFHCLWQAEYTVAPPCESLRDHDCHCTNQPCDACRDDQTIKTDFPGLVHDIVRRNNPAPKGMDELVRLELIDSFVDKVPYLWGLRGTDLYPDGNTVMSMLLRLRTPFSMLRYKPRCVVDFAPDQDQPLPMKAVLRIHIPGCYPDTNDLLLNMTDNAQHAWCGSGCKVVLLWNSQAFRNSGGDYSSLTVSRHVGPSYQERMQQELADEQTIISMVASAFRQMHQTFPPVRNTYRPRGEGQGLLKSTLVFLFRLLDVAPSDSTLQFSSVRAHNSNCIRLNVTVQLPDEWPRLQPSAIRFQVNGELAAKLADHYITVTVLKEGFVFT